MVEMSCVALLLHEGVVLEARRRKRVELLVERGDARADAGPRNSVSVLPPRRDAFFRLCDGRLGYEYCGTSRVTNYVKTACPWGHLFYKICSVARNRLVPSKRPSPVLSRSIISDPYPNLQQTIPILRRSVTSASASSRVSKS